MTSSSSCRCSPTSPACTATATARAPSSMWVRPRISSDASTPTSTASTLRCVPPCSCATSPTWSILSSIPRRKPSTSRMPSSRSTSRAITSCSRMTRVTLGYAYRAAFFHVSISPARLAPKATATTALIPVPKSPRCSLTPSVRYTPCAHAV